MGAYSNDNGITFYTNNWQENVWRDIISRVEGIVLLKRASIPFKWMEDNSKHVITAFKIMDNYS